MRRRHKVGSLHGSKERVCAVAAKSGQREPVLADHTTGPAKTGIHGCCAEPASSELLVVWMGAKIPVDENESVSATMPSFLDKAVGEICIDALGPTLFMRGQVCFGAGSGMQHISPPEHDGVPIAYLWLSELQ